MVTIAINSVRKARKAPRHPWAKMRLGDLTRLNPQAQVLALQAVGLPVPKSLVSENVEPVLLPFPSKPEQPKAA
jgi:hypothetical protein